MRKWLIGIYAAALALMPGVAVAAEVPGISEGRAQVVVIPIRDQISTPQLYILRRGLKEAIDKGVQTIVLDMETPGGAIDVTFEMLKALDKFPGKTLTYVNSEAMSAGALIAAGTDEIYFAPGAVIGAAAPVDSSGKDIEATMRTKIVSYLKARVRSMSEGKGYRSEVISAMIDSNTELKIGDEIIKPKDELLSLTANEAMREYGTPPRPLLGAGVAGNIDELLDGIHGRGKWSMTRLEVTWSEKLAQYLTSIAPVLMAIGMVMLFIEFKTPGFGLFGIGGGIVLAIVFLGHYAAGLSGHEPMLFFALGVLLLVIELFFFPGSIAFAVAGIALMFGSLVWSMADLWPSEPIPFTADVFLRPLTSAAIGMSLAIIMFLLILKFLPRGGPWGKWVLEAAVGGEPASAGNLTVGGAASSLVGKFGVAATALFPTGQVEIDRRRYEARVTLGFAEAGQPVVVTRHGEFTLEVEVVKS